MNKLTTFKRLQAEFEDNEGRLVNAVPLFDVCDKYLGLSSKKAGQMANTATLALPAFRLGSQKTPWLVSLVDLAKLIDEKEAEARTDWEARQ
jgi:hypothetical protein